MVNEHKLIEELSEAINSEWRYWSKDIAKKESLSNGRMERWQKLWDTPYSELSEEMKEADRKWARKVIEILKSHGIKFEDTLSLAVQSLFSERTTLTADEMCLLKNQLRIHINSPKTDMDSETRKQHNNWLNNIDTKLDLMDFCYHLRHKYGIEAF